MARTKLATHDILTFAITAPTEGQVLLHDGTGWINSPALGAREVFIATAAQTVFTTSNAYVVGSGQLSVYINGIKQYPATYTETSTTSFTLSSPAVVNDQVMAEISVLTSNYVQPPAVISLDDLTDATILTPVDSQVLTYTGTGWVNETPLAHAIKYEGTNLFGPGTNPGGNNNVVYGVNALDSNLLGGHNVAMGRDALTANPYSLGQVAIGTGALQTATTTPIAAADNLYLGDIVLIVTAGDTDFTLHGAPNNTPGTVFTVTAESAIGTGTVVSHFNSDGSNIAIGYQALRDSTTGYYNTAIGFQALAANTSGGYNTAIGTESMYNNTTGIANIAYGVDTLVQNTTGSNNTALGDIALNLNTTGSNNTAVGFQAGRALTTGSNNTIIGGYQGTAGMAGNVVLSTGDGTIRLQHDGTDWTSATPISMAGLILPSTTSPITLNGSVGTSGQMLTSAGAGATPTWSTPTSDLDTLTDVVITTPTNKDQLIYNGTSWVNSRPVMFENDITITADYTITTGKNAMSAGPVTIANGVTVTVPDGSTWSVV